MERLQPTIRKRRYANGQRSDSYIYQDRWTIGWGGNEQSDPTAFQFGTEMDVYATNYSNNTDKDTWLPRNGGSWSGLGSLL